MNTKKIFGLQHFSIVLTSMLWFASTHINAGDTQEYREIEWVELMPSDDLAALLNPPEYLAGIEDGSENSLQTTAKYEKFRH